MKVLSIDFDYFQDVTKDQLKLYPDGVDLPTYLTECTWGSHYASNGKELRQIGIRHDELEKVKEILKNQDPNIPVMIANSHVNIYDFIYTYADGCANLDITHIDMHHDFINKSPKLDCGNWLSHIMQEFKPTCKTTVKWIANPISVDIFGLDDILAKRKEFGEIEDTLDSIANTQYDMVFMCRSDTWTPPHLDSYFSELCDLITSHFDDVLTEKGITQPRTLFLKLETQMREAVQRINTPEKPDLDRVGPRDH